MPQFMPQEHDYYAIAYFPSAHCVQDKVHNVYVGVWARIRQRIADVHQDDPVDRIYLHPRA